MDSDPRLFVRQGDLQEYQKLLQDVKLVGWLWNEKLSKYLPCEVRPFQFTNLGSNISRGPYPLCWSFFDEKQPPATIRHYHDETNPAKCDVAQRPNEFFIGQFETKSSELPSKIDKTPQEGLWSDALLNKIHKAQTVLSCKDIGSFGGVWPATLILSGVQLESLRKFGKENVILRGLYFSCSGQKWKEIDLYPSMYNYRVNTLQEGGTDVLYESTLNIAYEYQF